MIQISVVISVSKESDAIPYAKFCLYVRTNIVPRLTTSCKIANPSTKLQVLKFLPIVHDNAVFTNMNSFISQVQVTQFSFDFVE